MTEIWWVQVRANHETIQYSIRRAPIIANDMKWRTLGIGGYKEAIHNKAGNDMICYL